MRRFFLPQFWQGLLRPSAGLPSAQRAKATHLIVFGIAAKAKSNPSVRDR